MRATNFLKGIGPARGVGGVALCPLRNSHEQTERACGLKLGNKIDGAGALLEAGEDGAGTELNLARNVRRDSTGTLVRRDVPSRTFVRAHEG